MQHGQNRDMANQKPKQARANIPDDAPIPPVRIDDEFHYAIRLGCKKYVVGATRLVNLAVKQFLEREGLWPEQKPET